MSNRFINHILLAALLAAGTAQAAGATDRKPYWQDVQVVSVNKEYPRTDFMTYDDRDAAMGGRYEDSRFYSLLNGTWKFYFVDSYKQLPDNITDPSVDASEWADIQVPEGTYWVIRKYSGADRAAARMDATWQNMTADSTLHAKEGYILQLTHPSEYSVELTFPAVDNSNKNRYFAADDVQVPLSKYVAEFSHNRSWNLVGNPYPAYYDSRLIEHSGPITVWDGDNYVAYSLEDDSYVLKPGEAFFVQRPDDEAAMVFAAEGRQLNETAVSRTLARRLAPAGRTVVNLTLTGDSLADRTRIVLNDEASPAYELERDASKFMSSNPDAPQLYSQADGVRYAINERPAADGRVSLGASFGHDGRWGRRAQSHHFANSWHSASK